MTNQIRIIRNEAANCITFRGTTVPAYFNACLSASIDSVDPTRINIRNDIRSEDQGTDVFEFSNVPYTRFEDKDGNTFASAQAAADYITSQGNVLALNTAGKDVTGQTINFRLDQTSTSIILSTGSSFGVNTVKAVNVGGLISIKSIGQGVPTGSEEPADRTHYESIDHTLVQINGAAVTGGLNDVINALNELFTVGAFESVVIADPYSTMVADVSGTSIVSPSYIGNGQDPLGADVYGSTVSGSLNGYLSSESINEAGEYFTFDIRVEGQIGFGLVHTQASYDAGHYSGNANYADPTTFGTSNSAHYGFQFSHWFHPTPNGPWTNYGANTAYAQGAGWYNSATNFAQSAEGADWLAGNPVKMRVGIDNNGFISIDYYDASESAWVVCARTTYSLPEGADLRLGIKTGDTSARVNTLPKIHILSAAPTMYFRWIESPDGEYDYPLFATAEEANYYDQNHDGVTGSGTSTVVVYPDDPTGTNWYKPDTGFVDGAVAEPSGITFESNNINWTEITSLTDADLLPPAFPDTTITVDELSAVVHQVTPAGATWTTTIGGIPEFSLVGNNVEGTAPEVTGDKQANPSDTTTVTIYRTNSYGTTQGTLTIIITNLTAPVTAISPFVHVSGSTALIDPNTMDDGSVVEMASSADHIADGKRFVIEQSYIETNILPALQASGDQYIIGLANTASDFSTLEIADFDAAIVWEWESSTSHTFKFYRDGSVVQNIVINSLTDAYYDYAIEANGTSAWLIACNVNSIMNEPSPADGGSFSHTYEVTNVEVTPLNIHMAALNTSADISATGITTLATPAAPVGTTTPFNKALDFSGSSEYAAKVNSSYLYSPLNMGNAAATVAAPTAGQTVASGHPWATAIVFKIDGNSSNQHIWNNGEGAGSTDDNIYLRLDANGQIYFGWGRAGELNECAIGSVSTSQWYAVYIGFNGTRLSGANATAANLADAFDIRITNETTSWNDPTYNYSIAANWTAGSVGGRMDRQFTGSFTIGGRSANRNFHGKVAAMTATTLRCGVAMPDATEIGMMLTNPIKWVEDYKLGNAYRRPSVTTDTANFSLNSFDSSYGTQVYLMGDGLSDSYSNGIRSYIYPSEQNRSKLQLNSMVSSDIETVTINGLT